MRIDGSRGVTIAQIRILVVDLPRLVRDMVEQAIAQQHDMAVVAHCVSFDDLLDEAKRSEPDIVIVGIEDRALPHVCLELMLEHQGVSVLGIDARSGRSWLYELRLEQVEIDEVSPADVVHSIRTAARRHTAA
jgi:chemotaxis response regulator CheB